MGEALFFVWLLYTTIVVNCTEWIFRIHIWEGDALVDWWSTSVSDYTSMQAYQNAKLLVLKVDVL